jgi:ketosteroid isomerase-like protein
MRSLKAVAAVTLIAATVSACERRQAEAAEFGDADHKANRDVLANFVRGVQGSHFDSVAALYAEDAVFMPPNEPAVRGRAQIQKWMSAFPKVTAFSATDEEIEGNGDIAYVTGRYKMSFVPPGAKTAVSDSGKFIEVRKRQPNGTWLITRDIFNSDVPLPTTGK